MIHEPIATEVDYQAALGRLDQIFFADLDPIDAIHFRMEQQCRWYRKADT